VSKLLLCPQSGRRHQLRLHCLALGAPPALEPERDPRPHPQPGPQAGPQAGPQPDHPTSTRSPTPTLTLSPNAHPRPKPQPQPAPQAQAQVTKPKPRSPSLPPSPSPAPPVLTPPSPVRRPPGGGRRGVHGRRELLPHDAARVDAPPASARDARAAPPAAHLHRLLRPLPRRGRCGRPRCVGTARRGGRGGTSGARGCGGGTLTLSLTRSVSPARSPSLTRCAR